ncbi:MAG: hypothetical protein L0212_01560 [Acidobacteria bacterium]|nr:hypothetical protein [Acidobacteriota bacterium]
MSATTVSGTFKRADGTPINGTIEFVLSQQAKTITPPVTFAPVLTTCPVTSGTISPGCTVQGNDTLDPAGTFYRVRVLDLNNIVVLPEVNYTLTGPAVDLGQLPVTATNTLVPPTGSVTGNLNVTGNLIVGGAATFGAGPDNFSHLRLLGLTTDPATVAAGSVFHRSDLNRIRFRVGGIEIFDGSQYLPLFASSSQTLDLSASLRIPGGGSANFKRLNQVRLVDPELWTETGVTAKIDAAIADCVGAPCLVALPSNLGAGNASSLPTNISLLDLRTAGQVHLGQFPTGGITGQWTVSWPDSKMATGTTNAALAINAFSTSSTGHAVNGLWAFCQGLIDSCVGVSQRGAQANGFLMDVSPDVNLGGAAAFGLALRAQENFLPDHDYYTPLIRLASPSSNVAPQIYNTGAGGAAFIQQGGALWLRFGDGTERRTAVAAPTGQTSAVVAGSSLLAAGHYRFKVSALNDVGESLPSTATTDLTITANQVIRVTWNKVVGARAYKVYAAFNASADPGTANSSYTLQAFHTSANGKLLRVLVEDDAGDGVGTATFDLRTEFASGGSPNNWSDGQVTGLNPLDEDRSVAYYLRGSFNTGAGFQPSGDRFNLDQNAFFNLRPQDVAGDPFRITYAGYTNLTSIFRLGTASTNLVNWDESDGSGRHAFIFGSSNRRSSLQLVASTGGQLLEILGGASGLDPTISTASGNIRFQDFNFTFGQIAGTNTGINAWASAVADGDTDGAFRLNTTTTWSAGNILLQLQNNGTERFRVLGDGNIKISGGVAADGSGFKHRRVTTGSIAAGSHGSVTVNWTTAFVDANYTVNCSVVEATAGTNTLRIHHLESVAAGSVVVRVVNDDGTTAKTGTLHCTAIHD